MEKQSKNGVMLWLIKRWSAGVLLMIFCLGLIGLPAAVPLAHGQEALTMPRWEVGMQWEIVVRQKAMITSGDPAKIPAATSNWVFKVERELTMDDAPAVVLSATRKSGEDQPETYQLYFLKSTLRLTRVVMFAKGLQGKKTVHDFKRSAEGPTVVSFGSLPLSMPFFGVADGNTEFTYTHCVNGPNGFVRKVTQSVENQGSYQIVRLKAGSLRIQQEWHPDFPWPVVHSVDDGRFIAEFVKDSLKITTVPRAVGDKPRGALRLDVVNTVAEFGPPRAGRWWPAAARVSRRPWSSGGETMARRASSATDALTSVPAWSGYFWPQYDGQGPHLWDSDGPLDKYDYYVHARTGYFPSPYATDWEYSNHRTTDPANTWWGHCNGWSTAAILEAEPAVASWAEGIFFTVADKKGIITEWHNDTGDDGSWGSRYYGAGDDQQDIYPYEFITVLIQHIYNQDEPIAADLDCHDEVWNHPIYGYYLEVLEEGEDEAKFRCEIYYALDDVRPDFIGTSEKIASYEFWCTVDQAGNFTPDGSSWAGDSRDEHPDFLWHPGSTRWGQGNIALEESFVQEIMDSRPTEFASIKIQHTYRGDLTIRLGIGDPQAPDWVVTLSDQEGGSADGFSADVDLSEALDYLPPSPTAVWFLEVADSSEEDEGQIQGFSITYNGQRYDAPNLPVLVPDLQANRAFIGQTAAPVDGDPGTNPNDPGNSDNPGVTPSSTVAPTGGGGGGGGGCFILTAGF